MPSKKNIEAVKDLTEEIKNSCGVILVDYRGLTANQIKAIRSDVRGKNAVMKVVKNNLISIALKNLGREINEEMFIDPTAVVFAKDDMPSAAKIISEAAKKNSKIQIKGGYMDEDMLSASYVSKVANVPSKEVLLSMLVTALEGPISGFVTTGQSIISDLPYILEAVKDKKSA